MDSSTHACQSYCDHTSTRSCVQKYKGIVFTDKDGKIIDDLNDEEDIKKIINNTLKIKGVDTTQAEITGVGNNKVEVNVCTPPSGHQLTYHITRGYDDVMRNR